MNNPTVTRYRLPGEWEVWYSDDLTHSTTEFRACVPHQPFPKKVARLATKLYVGHRKRFIRTQLDGIKRMEELHKRGKCIPAYFNATFLAQHQVYWRRPYVPAEDPDMSDAVMKLSFIKNFQLIPPTAPRAYPCRRSIHTLPNSRVEEHITQPILWQGLEAYDREFDGLDNAREDLPTYLAKFLASQENLSGNSDNMPRYGRSPILHQNS